MGQRANYIIKDHDRLTIHYNHWRANCIGADLYLGEKRFLKFVEECQLNDEILSEPWIEGCVIIDKKTRQLYFWSLHFPYETSVLAYYVSALAKKWAGWKIQVLKNRMYDAEKVLGIDYVSKQELVKPYTRSREEVLEDKVDDDWSTALVVIKNDTGFFVRKTGYLDIEAIISYGQNIIPVLQDKPAYELPNEEDEASDPCIVIDTTTRKIFISQSEFGLWEQAKDLWEDYEFSMGDRGYIETLRLAGIETANLSMPEEKVKELFNSEVNHDSSFNPYEMAKELAKENNDIAFNPDFFDTIKPQKTLWDKLKAQARKILRP
jgi:hypothetical protein